MNLTSLREVGARRKAGRVGIRGKRRDVEDVEIQEDEDFEEDQFQASHTGRRMLKFDIRTDNMEVDWYKKFTDEYRAGSFVMKGRNTVFKQSAKKEKSKPRLRRVLSASSARQPKRRPHRS